MIKEVITYDIICDNCGKSLTDNLEWMFVDLESAMMVAIESDWHIEKKHYCPDCFSFGDDDELVILNNQP